MNGGRTTFLLAVVTTIDVTADKRHIKCLTIHVRVSVLLCACVVSGVAAITVAIHNNDGKSVQQQSLKSEQ